MSTTEPEPAAEPAPAPEPEPTEEVTEGDATVDVEGMGEDPESEDEAQETAE
jgi:hypothetical protein